MAMITITINNAMQHAHRKIVDVLNHEFGKNYRTFSRSACNLGNNMVVWFPTILGSNNFEGWENGLSNGGCKIISRYVGNDPHEQKAQHVRNLGKIHIVFARNVVSGDRCFIGVFDSKKCNGSRIYNRIGTQITIDTVTGSVTYK